MNEFVQKMMLYNPIGMHKTLRLLQEMQLLLNEAHGNFSTATNQNNFHLKFLEWLNNFTLASRGVEDVFYHIRNNNSLWVRVVDDTIQKIDGTDFIINLTDKNEYYIIDEKSKEIKLLRTSRLIGFNCWAMTFQFFGFYDYIVVFEKINIRSKRTVSLIENLITLIKKVHSGHFKIEAHQNKIEQLEKELGIKEKELLTSERNLKRRVYEIHSLLEISNELYSILNLKQLINSALLIIVGQIGCQKAFTLLYDVNLRKFSKRFTKGFEQIELSDVEIELDHPLVNYFTSSHRPVFVEQLLGDESLEPTAKMFLNHKIEVLAPINHGDRVFGFIGSGALLSEQKFTKAEMEIFSILVNMISISISNALTYEEVKNLSLTDAMTNLNNYRYFEDRLKEEINRGRRNNTPVSLIMLDIDHFKNYNDTLGHQAGDEALRAIGWLLKNAVREEDIVTRYGGEEFCIILPGIEKEIINVLGERVRKKIEEYPFYKENVQPGGRITVSIGGSSFSLDADNFEELVYKADQALYKSKNSGRNRLTLYSADT